VVEHTRPGGRTARPRVARAPRALACLAISATIALAGCGSSDQDTQVKRAEARVTQSERAVADAQSAFEDASTTACESAGSYVSAVDRYGDILNATAPTVGDVRDAGSDLTDPREDALSAAEAAAEAQQALYEAEKELAVAQAELKVAKKGPSASATPTPTSPPSPKPLAPAATVKRVEQAEADFASAVEGISDHTPLAQASQQFNAAAVALELSWLRLLADAGCLTSEQQKQAEAAVSGYTGALQSSLTEAGYYDGDIDGVYGPATVDAVEALQQAHTLPVTGAVDKATDAALREELQAVGGAAAQDAVASTAAVQQTLKLAGYWDGPVDGEWTPALTEALMAFQEALGVKPTGAVDAATVAALESAIAAAAAAESPTADPSEPSSTPSPSATSSAASPTGSPST